MKVYLMQSCACMFILDLQELLYPCQGLCGLNAQNQNIFISFKNIVIRYKHNNCRWWCWWDRASLLRVQTGLVECRSGTD